MRTRPVITAVLTAALLTLGACADDSTEGAGSESTSAAPSASASSASPSASEESMSATPKPSPTGTTIKVKISGDTVTPNGARVKAEKGEPVTLQIDADKPGEIHVHSTPEQEIEYPAGKSTKKITIDSPGIVDVEVHALEQVIVQLEVS